MSTSQTLHVDWPAYHQLIETLASRLHHDNASFDIVLAVARGGLRVGDVISRIFNRPLAVVAASSYRAVQGTHQGKLRLGSSIAVSGDVLKGSVLIVDDMVDSGKTLTAVADLIAQQPEVTRCQTAVLWWKAASSMEPDYYACKLDDNRWIEQPFEQYDQLGLSIFKINCHWQKPPSAS